MKLVHEGGSNIFARSREQALARAEALVAEWQSRGIQPSGTVAVRRGAASKPPMSRQRVVTVKGDVSA